VDLPGCGDSEDPSEWTLDRVASDVAEAASSIPRPFTLVGNCSGALLGLLAARQIQSRVERMILIDIFAVYPWYFRLFVLPVLGPVAYYSTFANPLGRWIANFSLRSHRTEDTTLTGGFSAVRHDSTYRYLKLFENYPKIETFGNLRMAIDLVYGANTFRAIVESVPRWKALWPQAREFRLAGAGHLPIEEATGQLRNILFEEGSFSTECLIPSSTIAG
jgi:pimeloyl-ACP methyl ester carboxylesterase